MKSIKYMTFLLLVFASVYTSPSLAVQRVYLMAGQSNMMGLGNTRQLPSMYRRMPKNVTFIYQGSVRQLAKSGRFGPEVSFAHQVSRAYPNDEHIIIKFAATGSHIQQWLPGQHYYRNLLRQMTLSFGQHHPQVDAVLWMQGESDAKNSFRANRYATNLSRFIYSLRRDLRSPYSLFVIGQINPQGSGYPMVSQVQRNQQVVNSSVHNTHLISSYGLRKTVDNIHYSAQGQLELGRRFAMAYISRNRTTDSIPQRVRKDFLALFR